MIDQQELNLSTIHRIFFYPEARAGRIRLSNLIKRSTPSEANTLLRHHDERIISDEETWQRDEIDYLLAYYSILEIALTAKLILPDFQNPLFEQASKLLTYPPLRRYYEKNYPLELPRRLVERIYLGDAIGFSFLPKRSLMHWQLPSENIPESSRADALSSRLFFLFVPLVYDFERDSDVEEFLWMLDGGVRDRWDYERLNKVLRNPIQAASFLEKAKRKTIGGKVIRGAIKFLELCVSLDRILGEALDNVLLQEEMYLYFSYWFDASRGITKRTDALLKSLDSVDGKTDDIQFHIQSLTDMGRQIKTRKRRRSQTLATYQNITEQLDILDTNLPKN